MDHQRLTSNDHLSQSMGLSLEAHQEAGGEESEASSRRRTSSASSPRSRRRFFYAGGLASPSLRRIRDVAGRESLVQRYGLLTVREIQSEDLRTLLWHGIALSAVYVFAGGLWFMMSNRWTFTNTVYFLVISLLTVGYGDLVVNNEGEDRLIDSLLILLGLVTLGVWAAYGARASSTIRSRRGEGDIPVPNFDADSAIRRGRRKLMLRLLLIVVVIFVGVVAFMIGEDVGFTTSFYWAVVTSSSIGYGDVVPTNDGMKWFTIFYAIVATGSMLETLRFLGSYPFRIWALRAKAKVFEQFAKPETPDERSDVLELAGTAVNELLGTPPQGQPGGFTRSDFALAMLLMLDRISYEEYEQAARVYDQLNAPGSGVGVRVRRVAVRK